MIDKRLQELFLELIKIDAVSGQELPVAAYIRSFVQKLGFETEMDGAAELSGGNCGNLIVPIYGGGDFVLMAHMDTPRSTAEVKPQILADRITSDGTTVLGVDDRGGLSAILYALERAVKEQKSIRPCTLLFTVCEETSLAGSTYFKPSPALRYGYAFDSYMTPGNYVSGSCGAIAFEIEVKGKAAHSGIAPEKGINAVKIATEALAGFPFGRIDATTTANIGIIHGGTAVNVVPEQVVLIGEIRTEILPEGERLMAKVQKDFEEAAARHGGYVDISWLWDFKPYDVSPEEPAYRRLMEVGNHLKLPIKGFRSMGGSDANSMNAKGVSTIDLGVGAQNPHGNDEFILFRDLQCAAEMAYTLMTL